MRNLLRLLGVAAIVVGSICAATIQYDVVELGPSFGANAFRISYSVSGVSFATNQEFSVEFDPVVYLSLSNGVGPAGFDILLLPPDNPPGTSGYLSALALVDTPGLDGGFSVDVFMTGVFRPGAQSFSINQLDDNGVIVSGVTSGVTTNVIPEPATLLLSATALLIGGLLSAVRRRFRGTA